MRLCVIGAGSWGTALALAAARNHHPVLLYGHDPNSIAELIRARQNKRYLPGILFPDEIKLTADLAQAVQSASDLLIAVPSHVFGDCIRQLIPLVKAHQRICWATKGLDPESGALLHTLVHQHLPSLPCGVLSGPSFAAEAARGLPTAVVVASENPEMIEAMTTYFHSPVFRVYGNTDVIGVEIGGAVKNVLAIAAGISDGLGFGANARAALITRGLQEIIRLGRALHARSDTLMGLAGMGDLVLTCTDNQSRNRRFGLAIGQGHDREQTQAHIGQVVEGFSNAKAVYDLAKKKKVDMPIVSEVYAILYEGKPPREAVSDLMARKPTVEY
jgi:glycerol-3-phosphate dehydrogenase (NAD(P)+)